MFKKTNVENTKNMKNQVLAEDEIDTSVHSNHYNIFFSSISEPRYDTTEINQLIKHYANARGVHIVDKVCFLLNELIEFRKSSEPDDRERRKKNHIDIAAKAEHLQIAIQKAESKLATMKPKQPTDKNDYLSIINYCKKSFNERLPSLNDELTELHGRQAKNFSFYEIPETHRHDHKPS